MDDVPFKNKKDRLDCMTKCCGDRMLADMVHIGHKNHSGRDSDPGYKSLECEFICPECLMTIDVEVLEPDLSEELIEFVTETFIGEKQ